MATELSRRPICLVTGGAGGIGFAVCRSLAAGGRNVLIVDMDAERAADASRKLREEGFSASDAGCDVSSGVEVDKLRQNIRGRGETVSVLVNLAGLVRNAVLGKVTEEDFMLVMRSHLLSTLNTMRAFGQDMKQHKFGRIVNCSSIASIGSIAGSSYGAAKGGIESLSRSAALELAPHGITVNVVAPGVIGSGMFTTTPKEYQEKLISRTPMKRVGLPEEVAACVKFFTSPGASFVTGQTLFVCGGLSIGVMT